MSDSTPAKVKCQDCGFLAVRHGGTRALVEAEIRMRDAADLVLYDPSPVCFVRASDLAAEMELPKGKAQFLKVLGTERECQRFVKWQQGFTPREHKEMIDSQEQRERDRQWQFEQKRSDRRWHLFMVLLASGLSAGFTVFGWFLGSRR